MNNAHSSTLKRATYLLMASALILLISVNLISVRNPESSPTTPSYSDEVQNPLPSTTTVASPTVINTSPESIILSVPSEYIAVGHSMEISAKVSPSDAAYSNLIWSSDDSTIASVDESGVVTGHAPGETFITVRTDVGSCQFIKIFVVRKSTIYFSPSIQSDCIYPVGDTNESLQSRRIAEFCKEKLSISGVDSVICEDRIDVPHRAMNAKKSGAEYYVAIHTRNTDEEGASIAFNRRVSDSSRLSIRVRDSLIPIIETEEKGKAFSGLNFGIKELEYAEQRDIPAIFVEVQSHKSVENAQWIMDNSQKIGYCIADGIMLFLTSDAR